MLDTLNEHNSTVPPKDAFPYETIKYGGRLEMLDKEGNVATFTRRQRIRFLEDNVAVFFDRVWGEGVLFANYSAKSMRIIDAIPTTKGYVVPLALPRRFSKGEVFDVVTHRRIVGAFLPDMAYWDSAMHAPTELLALDVVAPRTRRFRSPEIIAPPTGDFDADASRGSLKLRVRQPALHASYRLMWAWK